MVEAPVNSNMNVQGSTKKEKYSIIKVSKINPPYIPNVPSFDMVMTLSKIKVSVPLLEIENKVI